MGKLDERGYSTFEYMGMIVIIAGILAALIGLLPMSFARAFDRAICAVASMASGTCPDGGPGSRASHSEPATMRDGDEFRRLRGPSTPSDRHPVARHGVTDTDDDAAGPGSSRDTRVPLPENTPAQVRTMRSASPQRFSQLVQQGTTYSPTSTFLGQSARNWRYFRTEPGSDDGVVVFDFFIGTETSGHIISGDDRGFPKEGGALSVPMDKSRFRVVIDRSTGRGVVIQSNSTLNGLLQGIQNEPQPIAIDEGGVIKNYDFPNHYTVNSDADSVTLEYEGVNSITRGPDVAGTLRIRRSDGGTWNVARRSGDNYPSVGVYYYEPSGNVQKVLEHQQENPPTCGATALDCDVTRTHPTPIDTHPPTEPEESSDSSPGETPVTVPTG